MTARWLLFPLAAIGGCGTASWATHAAAGVAELVTSVPAVEAVLPFDYRTGLASALAAVCFVVCGALVAPRSRLLVGFLLFAFGASLAWFFLRYWYFPETHPRGYQTSLVPLVFTLAGGVVGLSITWFYGARAARDGPAPQHGASE